MGGSSIHGGNTNSGAMITDSFGGGKVSIQPSRPSPGVPGYHYSRSPDEGDVKVATAILKQSPGLFWDTVYNPKYLTTEKEVSKSPSVRELMKEVRQLISTVFIKDYSKSFKEFF